MHQSLAQQSINFALLGNWKEAKDLNLKILKDNPNDIDALNRLAKSYFELGNLPQAKSTIKKSLKIDPYNPIAIKFSEKWKGVKSVSKHPSKQLSSELFLEEPGKTKIVHLIHICDKSITAKLNCGDIVYDNSKSHRVSIVDENNTYIGKLPDDLSIKLKKLIKLGYKYAFAIKSIEKCEIKVFIRETFRPESYSNKPSFLSERIDYIPYTPPELVHDRTEISSPEEESEMSGSNTSEYSSQEE